MSFLRDVYYRLPIGWRKALRKVYFLPQDIVGKKTRPFHVPPHGANFIGPGDFDKIGKEFFELSKKLVSITPNAAILEVGCGMGRMAYPYTKYLSEKGSYVGFDIVPEGIEWCKNHIAPNDDRFQFHLADIQNQLYNPNGQYKAEEFVFPAENQSFDYIFLTSVFTHMLPEEIGHYIREMDRALNSEGTILATFFLLNETTEKLIQSGKSMFNFSVDLGHYRTMSKSVKESNVAIEESCLNEMVGQTNLKIEAIHYGSWSGRTEFLSFQDIVILKKND